MMISIVLICDFCDVSLSLQKYVIFTMWIQIQHQVVILYADNNNTPLFKQLPQYIGVHVHLSLTIFLHCPHSLVYC